MSIPKAEAIVFCLKAVLTDPWWTLAGVFDELWLNGTGDATFDAYAKLANVAPGKDCIVRVSVVDSSSGSRLAESAGISRPDENGAVERALGFELTFPQEGAYFVELWLNDMYLDVRTIRVNIVGWNGRKSPYPASSARRDRHTSQWRNACRVCSAFAGTAPDRSRN